MGEFIPVGHAWVPQATPLPDRRPSDLYETPLPVIEQVLDELAELFPHELTGYFPTGTFNVLDPGCGDGRWLQATQRRFSNDSLGHGVELRQITRDAPAGYMTMYHDAVDFLTWTNDPFPLIVGNPPFSLADAFVERSLTLLAPGGVCALLLPSTFLFGQGRRDRLYRVAGHVPHSVLVHSQRISWSDDGRTPPRDTVVVVWKEGWFGGTQIRWLRNR